MSKQINEKLNFNQNFLKKFRICHKIHFVITNQLNSFIYIEILALEINLLTLANKNNINGMPPILLIIVNNPCDSLTLTEPTITVGII